MRKQVRRRARTILWDYDYDLATVAPSETVIMGNLLDEYGIPRDNPLCWWWLAYHLARRLGIEGIATLSPVATVKRGRKIKWNREKLLRLWADIEVMRKRRVAKRGVPDLCGILLDAKSRSRWRGESTADHLANMHTKANRLVEAGFLGAPVDLATRKEWVMGRFAQHPPKSNRFRKTTIIDD